MSTHETQRTEAEFNALKEHGQAALKAGRITEAEKHFHRMAELQPSNPSVPMMHATALISLGRLKDAIPSLRKASSLAPADEALQRLIGNALLKSGHPNDAAIAFERAHSSNPADLEPLGNLIQSLAQAGDYSKALEFLHRVFVLSTQDSSLLQAYITLNQNLNKKDCVTLAQARLATLQNESTNPNQKLVSLSCVNVEITTYCNLKCPGCCRTVGVNDGTWKNQHMSLETYTRIVADLPPTALFIPYGIGEPMLHPHIFDIIRIARNSGKFRRIMLTSNALSRDIDDFYRLFDLGLDTLCISVDSFDPILIEKTRAGTDVEKLKQRLKLLVTKFPGRIETRSVVSSLNIHTIPDILQELNGMGAINAYFQAYDDVGNPAGCLTTEVMANFEKDIQASASNYPNLRIFAQNFVASRNICRMPWYAPFITVDGDITPCCRIVNPKTVSFGNMLSTPFLDLWNSEQTRAWRSSLEKKSPKACEHCPLYVYRQ